MKFVYTLASVAIITLFGLPARAVVLTENYNFSNINQSIPDGSLTGLANQQTLASSIESISTVTLTLQISGGFNGDLYAYVAHDSGLAILLNRAGRTSSNSAGYSDTGFSVTFSDSAANGDIHLYRTVTIPSIGSPLTGTWQPDGRNVNPLSSLDTDPRSAFLSSFNALNPDGNWTLFIADANSASAAATTSTLVSWGLTIQGQGYGSLIYDSNTGTTGTQDGSGAEWNSTNANFWNGTSNVVWSNTIYDTAVFGAGNGVAGVITVGTVNANGITFNAASSGNYTLSGGTITFGGATPTITANVDATINSTIAGASLTKAGLGALTLSGANTYTGVTTIAPNGGTLKVDNNNTTTARLASTSGIVINMGGTLLLSQTGVASADRINNAATVNMAGGTLNTGGLSEGTVSGQMPVAGLGALTLSANSILDLGSGMSIIAFADSSAASWTSGTTLKIYNWSGNLNTGLGIDEVFFGSNNFGLTAAQLGQISFYSDAGGTFLGTAMFSYSSNGEIVPVPEPATLLGGFALAGLLIYRERKWLPHGLKGGKLLREAMLLK